MREVSRIQPAAPEGVTREQEAYAEKESERYGRSMVSRPAPEGMESLNLGIPTGAVVITGMTDDIERSKAIVAQDGSLVKVIF